MSSQYQQTYESNKASYNYWIAGFAALALAGGALYYSLTLRKPKPPSEETTGTNTGPNGQHY